MKRIFLILLPLFTFSAIASQAKYEMSYKNISIENGLSNNLILDIEADNFGFIWVATDEGLNIMAGDKIRRVFKSDEVIGLPGNELNCLLNDRDNNTMWIGTQRNGIVCFNYLTGERKLYNSESNHGNRLSGNGVTSFALGQDGEIWVGTYARGVNCINKINNTIRRFDISSVNGLKSDMIWSIDFDQDDDILYAGHEKGGFSEINVSERKAVTYTESDGLPDNTVRKVLNDGNSVWVCTDGGLARFDKVTKRFCKYEGDFSLGRCLDIIKTKRGMVLAYEDFGVVMLNDISGEFIHLDETAALKPGSTFDALRLKNPRVLFMDSFKNLLVGTKSHGLTVIFADKSYFTVKKLASLPDKSTNPNNDSYNILSVATLPEGEVWIAIDNKGAVNLSNDNSTDGLLEIGRVSSIAADKDGDLWVCDGNGNLVRFSPKFRNTEYFKLGIKDNDWTGIDIMGDSIWISSNEGIFIFDRIKRKLISHYDVENNMIRKIAKDEEGILYVGTFGQGLTVLDRNMHVIRENKVTNGFSSNTVNDILIDGKNIWVATGAGLVKINADIPDDYKVMAQPSRTVKSVMKDNLGNVWFAISDGVGVVLQNDSIVLFDSELPVKNFNIRSHAMDSFGILYLGSSNGLMSFNPESVLNETSLAVPLISGISIDGENSDRYGFLPILDKKKITLNYDNNNFSIIINNLDFFRQGDSFEYRMLGIDNKWYPVGEGNRVSFRELRYGKYLFEVRNAKGDGVSTFSAVEIEILPPFWLRWWAILTYLLLLAAVALFVILWYKKRLKRRSEEMLRHEKEVNQRELQEERMAFLTNITHELRTPLTLISGPLEDLIKSETLDKDDKWKIRLINKNAQRLLHLVKKILDFRKTETCNKRLCVCKGNIISTIEEATLKFIELNRNNAVKINVKSGLESLFILFDREVIIMIL